MTKERKIRVLILASGFRCYEVAKYLQIAPCTLSVWLRAPISKEHEKRIKKALVEMKMDSGEMV